MNKLIILFFLIFLLFSCKKQDCTPDNNTSTTDSTNGNPTLQTNGSGTTNYDVLFEVIIDRAKYAANYLAGFSNSRALFCSVTTTNEVQLNLSDMGAVKLNNITFTNHFGAMNYYYTDSTYTNMSAPYI